MEVLHASSYLNNERDVNIHTSIVKDKYIMHTHDFIEMVFIISGKGMHTVDGETYQIRKGDIFILNKNIAHSFEADEGTPIEVYNCIFQPGFIEATFSDECDFATVAYKYLFYSLTEKGEEIPEKYIKITGMNTQEIKIILDGIMREYRKAEKGYLQIIHAELTKLLILVFRLYHSGQQKQIHNYTIYQQLVIEHSLEYMKKHYQEDITCEKLAKREYLSTSYFCKLFREEIGISVIQMLQKIRMEAAGELLNSSVFNVSVIAELVGYSDLKYFYKIFKKVMGYTPREYKKLRQNQNAP